MSLSVQPPLVLVADDEPLLRSFLAAALPAFGLAVLLAADGKQAVDLFRQRAHDISLVLLDVRMPGLDGPSVLQTIRAIDPDVKCCFMSGDLGGYDEKELQALGCRVLYKPFSAVKLAEVLRELLAVPHR